MRLMTGCKPQATSPKKKHRVQPVSNHDSSQRSLPESPHPSSRVPPRARSACLSHHAYSAKVQWEATHGEPCPYARPAPPRLCGDARRRLRGPAVAVHNRRLMPQVAPDAQQQDGFGKGFYKTPSTSAEQPRLWFDSVEREGTRCVRSRTGRGAVPCAAATGADARQGGNKTTWKKDSVVHRSAHLKFEQSRKATPTLLEMHQRVIDAALLEISRPREGPFANLGEHLGGEHDAFTYRSQDSIVSSGGGGGEITESLLGPATNTQEQHPSAGKRRTPMLTRHGPRPRTKSHFRTRTVNAPDAPNRSTMLPPLESHEPWKIPLLRTSWASSNGSFRSSRGDSLGDIEYVGHPESPGTHELDPQEEKSSAAATAPSERIALLGAASATAGPLNSGTNNCCESAPRPHAVSNASFSSLVVPISSTAEKESIGENISTSPSEPLATALDNDALQSDGETSRTHVDSCAAFVAAATHLVEELVLIETCGKKENLSPNAAEKDQCDGGWVRNQVVVATESRAMAHQCYLEYQRQGLNARLGQLLDDGTLGVLTPKEVGDKEVGHRNTVASTSAHRSLCEKGSHIARGNGATAPISGTTTPISTDSSSVEFTLYDDSSMESDGRGRCRTSVGSGQLTNHHEIHAITRVDRGSRSTRTEAIAKVAATAVGGWVFGVIDKLVCPNTVEEEPPLCTSDQVIANATEDPPACASDRIAIANAAVQELPWCTPHFKVVAKTAATAVEGWMFGVIDKAVRPNTPAVEEPPARTSHRIAIAKVAATPVVEEPPACTSDRTAIANAAALAVEGWVFGVIDKSVRPHTPVLADPPACISDQNETERGKEDNVRAGETQRNLVAPPGIKPLPFGLLEDIVARRASLKPVTTSREAGEEYRQMERIQRELDAERAAKDTVSALRDLDILVHTKGLDIYDPEEFSREGQYGEGRYSVVYRVCASRLCREVGGDEDHEGNRNAAMKSLALRESFATTTAREASVDILATAVAAVMTMESTNRWTAVAAKQLAVSAVLAVAFFESVSRASLSTVAAAAGAPRDGETTRMVLAAKEFRYVRADVPASILRQVHREVCMHLRVCGCTHVVALRGVWMKPRVTILLEPMNGGNLHNFVRARVAKDEARKSEFKGGDYERQRRHAGLVADVAEGLAALHNVGIVHRDVKSHNVMLVGRQQAVFGSAEPIVRSSVLDRVENRKLFRRFSGNDEPEWTAKLGDLGSAALVPRKGQPGLTEEIGTRGWVAPEVFTGNGYGTPADIFSLGILIWDVFVCGALENPMCGMSGEKLMENLRPRWPQPPLPVVPSEIEKLTERCWALEPEARPTASAVAAELRVFYRKATIWPK